MFFRLGLFSILFIIWSQLSLLLVSQLHPIAVGSVVFVVICLFFRDKLILGRRGAGVVCAVSLLACYGCTRILSYDDTGMFLGIGTMSLTILACWLVGVTLLVKLRGYAERLPLGFAAALIIGCSMTTYIKVVALVALPAVVLLSLSLREATGLKASFRLAVPLLLTISMMFGLTTTLNWSESKLSYIMGLFSLLPPSGFNFPTSTSLSALQRWNNSDIVVLRGYGSDPPLYLVGRTFSEFDDKNFWRWKTTKQELTPEDQMLVETRTGPRAVSVFFKSDTAEEHGPPFRIEYPKAGNGLTLYRPREMYGVAADIERLHLFSDGMLQTLAKERLDGGEYALIPYKDGWEDGGPPEPLPEEEREQYLALSETVTPEVARLAEEIAGDVESPGQKADFITAYLQQNFEYGYDFPFQSSQTALEEFLIKRPPAHCEFFATAAALMLRSQGVPTRYINGFVLQEKSLDGDYYVIRFKHAHAWIEAYIPGEGWVTYDPTPPGTLGDPDDRAGLSSSFAEMASNFWRKFTNFFSMSPSEMLDEAKAFFKSLSVWDYLKLLCLVAIWGLWKLYRRKRPAKKKMRQLYRYDPGKMEGVTPLLERLGAAVPGEWSRSPTETPVAWVRRLGKLDIQPELLTRLEAFAHEYTRVRFRAGEQDQDKLNGLENRVIELENQMRGLDK